MLSVTFATRGAMATNKPVIEVLHFVGAKNGFIAGRFQRHFLLLGLQGGAIGGGIAIVLFALAGVISGWFAGTAGGDQTAALFGIVLHRPCRLYRRARPSGADRAGDGGDLPAYGEPDPGYDRLAHDPEKHVPDLIGDGNRFSEKIMRRKNVRGNFESIRNDVALTCWRVSHA